MPFANEKVLLPCDQKYVEVDIFNPKFENWNLGSLYVVEQNSEIARSKFCKKEFIFK